MPPSPGQPASLDPLHPIEQAPPPARSMFVDHPESGDRAVGEGGFVSRNQSTSMIDRPGLRQIHERASFSLGPERPIKVLVVCEPLVIQPYVEEHLTPEQ